MTELYGWIVAVTILAVFQLWHNVMIWRVIRPPKPLRVTSLSNNAREALRADLGSVDQPPGTPLAPEGDQ